MNCSRYFIESLEEIELSFSFLTYPHTFKAPTIRLYLQSSPSASFSLHDQIAFANLLNTEQEKMFIELFSNGINNLKTEMLIELSEANRVIGESKITLSELLYSAKASILLNMSHDCEILVKWAVPENPSLSVHLTVESLGLRAPSSWFSKLDFRPKFQVYRCISESEDALIYTSEMANTKSFNSWNKFTIKARQLCKGVKQNAIKIQLSYKVNEIHKIFGEAMFSLEQILNNQHIFTLADEGKQRRVGSLKIACEMSNCLSLNDYVQAGLRFNSMLAVQSSNKNDCQEAIEDMWPFLIQANNTSSNLPVYVIEDKKKQSAEGSLSVKSQRGSSLPCASNLSDLYQDIQINSKFLSNCRVSNIIEKAKYLAKFNALYRNQEYVIVLILTDGRIKDIREVNRQIQEIEDGDLPVSIVFLGTGDDFEFEILEQSLYKQACTSFIKYEKKMDPALMVREITKEILDHLKEFIDKEKKGGINQYELFWNTKTDQNKFSLNLRFKLPPMVRNWICQNDQREFLKSKDMIDKTMLELVAQNMIK